MSEEGNWMYYTLTSKKDSRVVLSCCIDINTIDDDEPDCEFIQNDGRWSTAIPDYWVVDGDDLTMILEEVKGISCEEWDVISQIIVDNEMTCDEISVYEFENATLRVSYDWYELKDIVVDKKTTIQVTQSTKDALVKLGTKKDTYDSIIKRLIGDEMYKVITTSFKDGKLSQAELLILGKVFIIYREYTKLGEPTKIFKFDKISTHGVTIGWDTNTKGMSNIGKVLGLKYKQPSAFSNGDSKPHYVEAE